MWRSTTVNGNDAFLRLGRDLERTGHEPRGHRCDAEAGSEQWATSV
jgi:hypothetical protein